MFDTMRSENMRRLRGRVVYVFFRGVFRILRVVFFLPISLLHFAVHRRFRPKRGRFPRSVGVFLWNASTLAYIAGSSEITLAHFQAAIDAGGELLPRCGWRSIRFSTEAERLWKIAIDAAGGLNEAALDHLRTALASR